MRATWRPSRFGGMTRQTADGATVTIRQAWDGGYRVTISRPEVFGRNLETGEPTYVHQITHSRIFNGK